MLIKVSEMLFVPVLLSFFCGTYFIDTHLLYIFPKDSLKEKAGRSCTINILYVTLQPE